MKLQSSLISVFDRKQTESIQQDLDGDMVIVSSQQDSLVDVISRFEQAMNTTKIAVHLEAEKYMQQE